MIRYLLQFFVLFPGMIWQASASPAINDGNPTADSLELVAFYQAMDGSNWTNNANWLVPGQHVATWYGVSTDSAGFVTGIDLFNNNLTGQLDDLAFPRLRELSVHFNQITGEVPDFSGLPELEILKLSNNPFSGEIPEFTQLPNLTELRLSLCGFTGTVPSYSGSPNLVNLFLSYNQLTGVVPEFSDLTKLEDLQLNNNLLTGSIPDLNHLKSLRSLSLSFNQLSGEIPDLSGLEQVTSLWLSDNQLSGPVPLAEALPPLIATLVLNTNQLSGPVPDLSGRPSLKLIRLENNLLTGEIPDFASLPLLTMLDLSRNQLTGEIPDFSQLPKLERLILVSNNLSGLIPDFSALPSLTILELSDNQLTGPIPDFSQLPSLEWLLLRNNQLSGTIPDFSSLPALESIGLEHNLLSGSIPDFSQISGLKTLFLSHNLLEGAIPDFSQLPNLQRLQVEHNRLINPLPSLSNCPLLQEFYFSHNQFEGSVPPFDDLANLTRVRASYNAMSGDLPGSGQWTTFAIDGNRFTFSDILSSGYTIGSPGFKYAPQQAFYSDTTIQLMVGSDLVLDLGIDAGLSDNLYTWMKDSLDWTPPAGNDPNSNQLILSDLTTADAGRYTVSVTNSNAPVLVLNSRVISIQICAPQEDSLELVNLFLETGGVTWDSLSKANWLVPGQPISTWYGITVDVMGCAQAIDLEESKLSGNLPALAMNTLDTLYLPDNNLSGTMPELATPFLTAINLGQNEFSGDLPSSLATMYNLRELNVSLNQLDGTIPPDLGDLCELESLRMNGNQFSGELPVELTMLTNLVSGQVDFSDNLIDSLRDPIIWFCPYGDTILEINPSYDRFLGICNLACSGSEWDNLNDFPWIVDTLEGLDCASFKGCVYRTTDAGFVTVRGVTVAYTRNRCYTSVGPPTEFVETIRFMDCAGQSLEMVEWNQDNEINTLGVLMPEEILPLSYDIRWQCGQDLDLGTSIAEPTLPTPSSSGEWVTLTCAPNPAQGWTYCPIGQEVDVNSFRVTNLLGQVFPVEIRLLANGMEVNLHGVPAGHYIVNGLSSTGPLRAKIIVQ